jgi:hypothetical protein
MSERLTTVLLTAACVLAVLMAVLMAGVIAWETRQILLLRQAVTQLRVESENLTHRLEHARRESEVNRLEAMALKAQRDTYRTLAEHLEEQTRVRHFVQPGSESSAKSP